MATTAARIESVRARAYVIPTDRPEADGTFSWTSTTLVLVEASAAGKTGLGYTYADRSITTLIAGPLGEVVKQHDAMDAGAAWIAMQRRVRNLGRQGLAACAISAVDAALWDLKAKLLGLPLALLLGRWRDAVPIYGSGGFTTYSDGELRDQLGGWVERDGCAWVKMKIGTHPSDDPRRVAVARAAIGDHGLFVDANGALTVKQALALAERLASEAGVLWFEEPVSSDDLAGLRLLRRRAPAAMEIAAGEYGYDADYFRNMLSAGAVDVQQADATRCGGVTGFLQVAALCDAHHIDLSAHCAPAVHLHAACAVPRLRHLEWFHDHVRIEHMLFDGAPTPQQGAIRPDLSRAGLGLVFKHRDAERYLVA
ncbi:MAG TPA: enolase C-terminal domain-like protein [Stellaceae bacterium]|nr:enolase C-terminal domain-like protein [Stellaceae bacterium]